MVGRAIFTTEPSINAMLDPRIVATSVRRLRFSDRLAGKAGVARMTPASQGGRVKPTIWASKKRAYDTKYRSCAPRTTLACVAALQDEVVIILFRRGWSRELRIRDTSRPHA